MKYQDNSNKEKDNQNVKSNFSKEFASRYDEIDKLTEQTYIINLM